MHIQNSDFPTIIDSLPMTVSSEPWDYYFFGYVDYYFAICIYAEGTLSPNLFFMTLIVSGK
jgi:hypothetical protein